MIKATYQIRIGRKTTAFNLVQQDVAAGSPNPILSASKTWFPVWPRFLSDQYWSAATIIWSAVYCEALGLYPAPRGASKKITFWYPVRLRRGSSLC